jgi:PH (Pleckstrin Homology) domain-containing protein
MLTRCRGAGREPWHAGAVELRHSAPSDEPDPVAAPVPAPPRAPDQPPAPAPTQVSFRVDGRLTAVKVTGAVVFVLLTLAFLGDAGREFFGGAAAAVLAGYAVRDLVAPRRLTADREGVTLIAGFAGHRRLGWDQIQTVRVDRRRRLGTRSELLEIDTGDELHLFSGYDLGMPVWQAVGALAAVAPPGLTEVPTAG